MCHRRKKKREIVRKTKVSRPGGQRWIATHTHSLIHIHHTLTQHIDEGFPRGRTSLRQGDRVVEVMFGANSHLSYFSMPCEPKQCFGRVCEDVFFLRVQDGKKNMTRFPCTGIQIFFFVFFLSFLPSSSNVSTRRPLDSIRPCDWSEKRRLFSRRVPLPLDIFWSVVFFLSFFVLSSVLPCRAIWASFFDFPGNLPDRE